MSFGKTCGKCKNFLKVNWHDSPNDEALGQNGICERYDYNVRSDGTYAQSCLGYKGKRYVRPKEA